MHHAHYKGTLFIGEDKVNVVYIDSTHLHPITDAPADASSELPGALFFVDSGNVIPLKSSDGKVLLRYVVSNRSPSS